MSVKTIGKNRKREIARIFTEAKKVAVYSLSNNFTAEEYLLTDASRRSLEQALYERKGVTLTTSDEKKYTLHIHSNLWYYIYLE